MSKFRGVLLDIDGTLVDSNDAHARAWVEALRKGGYEVSFEEVRNKIGMGGDNLLPNLIGVEKDTPEGKKLSDWWSEIFKGKYLPNLKAFPRARDLLARMREGGLKLVIASSTEEDLLKPMLKLVGAEDLIQDETTSADAESSKPDPDIVQAALDKIGLPPGEVLLMGDTPYDIEASHKAGVSVIAVRCGGWNDEDLSGAIAIYDDSADLLAHYDESPLAE